MTQHQTTGKLSKEGDWREQMTITVDELAKILNVGRAAAYECVRKGEVDVIRIGASIRVCVAPLLKKLGAEKA